MQQQHSKEYGVTLIELLVSMAILTILLAGIYGLLQSAYQIYNHNLAKLESQQTANIAIDYLVFRLREIDAGRITTTPYNCTYCHKSNMDSNANKMEFPIAGGNSGSNCPKDVTIPQQAPMLLELRKLTTTELPPLDGIPAEFQNMTGNYIRFVADLLPLHGFNESFTDFDGDGEWDWTACGPNAGTTDPCRDYDLDGDGEYDPNEPEWLNDMNDNSEYDYFGETWTLELQKSSEGPYYELVESLDFSSLHPLNTDENTYRYNRSVYVDPGDPNIGFTKAPVVYGITGLRIRKVPRLANPASTSGKPVDATCANNSCHGNGCATTTDLPVCNIFQDKDNFSYAQFVQTHPFWNIGGLSVEVTTVDTKAQKEEFTTLRQFVILRNVEVNQ